MSSMKTKRRGRRIRRRAQHYRRSVLTVCGVILLLAAVLSVNALQLRAKAKEYQAQETELTEQIEEEKARSAQIDDLEEYVGTEEYVEEIARDKLGMVHENEIIFKAK